MKDEKRETIRRLRDKTDAILQRDTSISQRLAEVNERDINALRTAAPRDNDTEKDNS